MNRPPRAFTLIELMVVIALIALISAVLVPSLIRARQRAQLPPAQAELPAPSPPQGNVPEKADLLMNLVLSSRVERQGMDAVSRYLLTCDAHLELTPGSGEVALLEIPLPADCQIHDVSLRLTQGQRSWDAEDLILTPGALYWAGPHHGLPLSAELHYQARGQDRLLLGLPRAQRLGRLQIALDSGSAPLTPGLDSLAPTVREGKWGWDYRNLLTPQPLAFELSASQSPMGRVLLLCRLVSVAVALFGLGFWYLGELYQPGLLSNFRFGSFFLLALTYSFFFPALAVLTLNEGLDLPLGLAWAAGLSLPLLMLHVSRVVDARFALFYVLPLAVMTLIVVVNGVFGGPSRDLVYLGAGSLTVSFLTLSFRRWQVHRQLSQVGQEEELSRRALRLEENLGQARDLMENARELAAPAEAMKDLGKAADQADLFLQELSELPRLEPFARRCQRRSELEAQEPYLVRQLGHSLRGARLSLQQARKQHGRAEPQKVYCTGCGQPGAATPCCPHCGLRRPRQFRCSCGCTLLLPSQGTPGPHCPGCGQARPELAEAPGGKG